MSSSTTDIIVIISILIFGFALFGFIIYDHLKTIKEGEAFCLEEGYKTLYKGGTLFCATWNEEDKIIIKDKIERCGDSFCFVKESGK